MTLTKTLRCVFLICLPLVVAMTLVSGCAEKAPTPDLDKRDAVVGSVMKALNEDNKQQLVKLAGNGPQRADTDAQKMIDTWGGVKVTGYSVSYSSEFTPDVATVNVEAADKQGKPVTIRFSISWHDSAWLLNIGQASSSNGSSKPASPQRPNVSKYASS